MKIKTIQDYLDTINSHPVEIGFECTEPFYSREDVIKIMEEYGEQKYDEGYNESWDEISSQDASY